MAITISGRLKKPAREFAAGEQTGFAFNLNKKVKVKGEDVWTTYSVAIFSKSQPQIDFYRANLVENTVVECSAKDLIIDKREYEGKDYLSIKLVYAQLDGVYSMGGQQPTQPAPQQNYQQPAPQQQSPRTNNQPNPQTQKQGGGFDDFDDDIPF